MSIVGPSSIPPLSPELDPADYLPLDPPADELLPDMTPPPQSQSQSQSQLRSSSPPPTGLIVGAVVGGLVLLVVLVFHDQNYNQMNLKVKSLILFILYFNELVN